MEDMKKIGVFIVLVVVLGITGFNSAAEETSVDSTNQIPIEGLEAEVKGDMAGAIKIYNAYVSKNPKNINVWKKISDIESDLKHYNEAAAAMKKAIELDPKNTESYSTLSEIYSSADMPKEAVSAIEQALQLDPNNINYLKTRSGLADWLDDLDKMEDSYNRILKIEPKDRDALLGILKVREERKNQTKE